MISPTSPSPSLRNATQSRGTDSATEGFPRIARRTTPSRYERNQREESLMSTVVKLTLLERGSVAGEFVFSRPSRCVVGRALDCDIAVPADTQHQDVSRHHCAFDIDPP